MRKKLVSWKKMARKREWSWGPTTGPRKEAFTGGGILKSPLFLILVTRWLGGKGTLVGDLGVPTEPLLPHLTEGERKKLGETRLIRESEAQTFFEKSLGLLKEYGVKGLLAVLLRIIILRCGIGRPWTNGWRSVFAAYSPGMDRPNGSPG